VVFFWLLAVTGCSSQSDDPDSASLSGAPNFREVGGYATSDGRRVKKGVLYRSGDLASLNLRDLEKLSILGIRQVFDLRHDSESSGNPDLLPSNSGISLVEIPVFYVPLDRRESRRKILDAEVEDGHFHQLLIEANRAFALDFTHQWSEVVQGLALPGALPVLIHCVDGKDRTGFVVAVILRAVGVPPDVILEDYLLSNNRLEGRIDRLSFLASLGSLFRIPRSEIRPLLEVRQEYLEAAFAAIDEKYGSFDAYLEEGLGLNSDTLARLRYALLE
jgi:protein-tyrosine phosphatase